MLRIAKLLGTACLVAACSADAAPNMDTGLPEGVRMEATGYWTIESAPSSSPPARVAQPVSNRTIYAEIARVSNQEAERRVRAQERLRPEFERLTAILRTKERGNYTGAELIHRPDWAYLLYFKRTPAATLAKYTRNPRFRARPARYTESELKALIEPWIDRLSTERLFTGFGLNTRLGRADVDMVVSESEYRAIADSKGWGATPGYIKLTFAGAPAGPDVDPSVAAGLRIFAHGDRNLGLTNQAAFGGRIVLRDGCFYVIGLDGSEKLAYFAREVGVGRDFGGYLSLHRRAAGSEHLGRIGEMFTWAGPIAIDESAPMIRELRRQCGSAPLMHVGVPTSSAIFNARYGLPRNPVVPPPPPRPSAR
jgi:hypothetical protein